MENKNKDLPEINMDDSIENSDWIKNVTDNKCGQIINRNFIDNIIKELAKERPIFHSEADFQHALAWLIHKKLDNPSVRLEFKPPNYKIYLDIWVRTWVRTKEYNIAIELKYKTRGLEHEINGEKFGLLNQSAQDHGRYDFLKDIQRIEKVASENRNTFGYAIFLTNDSAYWKEPAGADTFDTAFRINENKEISGELRWGKGASEGTIKNRKDGLSLRGSYQFKWQDYHEIKDKPYGKMRYLLVEIRM